MAAPSHPVNSSWIFHFTRMLAASCVPSCHLFYLDLSHARFASPPCLQTTPGIHPHSLCYLVITVAQYLRRSDSVPETSQPSVSHCPHICRVTRILTDPHLHSRCGGLNMVHRVGHPVDHPLLQVSLCKFHSVQESTSRASGRRREGR